MPYTSKRAKRMARKESPPTTPHPRAARVASRWLQVAVAVALLLVGCADQAPPTGPQDETTIVQLRVWPQDPTVQLGDSIDFVAFGLTALGDTTLVEVVWSAQNGELRPDGKGQARYQPRGHGRDKVKATADTLADSTMVTVTEIPVAAVEVTPVTAALVVGGTTQLTATAKDKDGNALTGRTVSWSTSDGAVATVNGAGLVTAQGAGRATVTATSEGQTGAAQVTVTDTSPPPVASVEVTPGGLSLSVGQTGQLTATPRDAAGNALTGRTVSWSTSDGAVATVSGNGLVMAQGAGTATITATSEGNSGAATVTVTGASGQVLFSEGFEDANLGARGWYDDVPRATVTTTEHHSGGGALEIHWPQGSTSPHNAIRRLFSETETLYVSYWVKYSPNYVGSGQGYQPHEFGVTSNRDDPYSNLTYSYLYAYIEQNYQNGGIPVLRMQDARMIDTNNINVDLTGVTENRAVAGCNGNTDGTGITSCFPLGGLWYNGKEWWAPGVAFQDSPGLDYKGDWNHVEVYFQLNTIADGTGQTDGVVRYWLNGNLKIEHTNVLFRTGANSTLKFNQFLITPYIGDGSPADQYMWVDDLVLATGRP